MSQALYRKYRSRNLSEVLGQDHITEILRAALEQGKIAHAYLLTGPRGVGKTSVARILAYEINKLPYDEDATHLDIIEIDAASNNGVDDIRNLREKSQVAPVSATKKVYIIDEVHMLSKQAFNALLKILEEPPEHVVFILATTDVDRLPATIISRVQQFYFHPISANVIAKQLSRIAELEGFKIEPDAAKLIAEHSHGGFRDAISSLDQLSPLATKESLTTEKVASHLGLSNENVLDELLTARSVNDTAKSLDILHKLETDGIDPVVLTRQLLQLIRQRLPKQPELVKLISQLIEVTNHPHPDLKLLTIFASQNHPIESASQKATPTPTKHKSSIPPKDNLDVQVKEPSTQKNESVEKSKSTDKPSPKSASNNKSTDFNWQEFLHQANAVLDAGRYAQISKCDYSFDGENLILYAGTKFAATKLNDNKSRPQLIEIAQKITNHEITFTVKPDKKPPEDSQLAEIAAMMGGGEEIKLEDIS